MSTPDRYRRSMEVFDEVREVAPEEQDARLKALCGDDDALRRDVESLLQADEHGHRIVDAAEAGKSLERMADGIEFSGVFDAGGVAQVGAYRIVREIGRGGMGIIYEAQQQSPNRRVALKVLRPGLIDREMLKRFQHEAHVLGQLQHSGIAQIFEAGVADTPSGKRPYFVMELIDGEPLDQAASTRRLNVRQRLELLARVCDAVQHAHQKGIIHRDLKPSNVLVCEAGEDTTTNAAKAKTTLSNDAPAIGLPKVLDFGIARVTDTETQTITLQTEVGQLVGTLAYMSPEQVTGHSADLDTRCDVYALGVMLYELLAGRRPHDLSSLPVAEAARRIREDEPPRLGTFDKRLRGDVETIVFKALEKDRERRYGSAAELAADLRRHLNDQPIDARPASTFYQINKFAKRNKGLVGGLAAAIIILIVGLGVTAKLLVEVTKQKNDAIAARKEADSARDAANDVTEFQLDQLAGIDVPQMGNQLKAHLLESTPENERADMEALLTDINFTDMALETLEKNIFERSIRVIDGQFAERPLIQARLFQAVANTQRKLGLLKQALEPQKRTVEIRRRVLGNEDASTLNAIALWGGLFVELGRFDEAEPLIQESIETGRRSLGERDPQVQKWIGNRIALLFQEEHFEEALPLLERSLAVERETEGADSSQLLVTIGNLASVLIKLGRLEEAEPYAHEVLESRRRTLGEAHRDTLSAATNLGALLRKQGKLTEAEGIYRKALETRRKSLGDEHPDTLSTVNNLAAVLYRQGRFEEAEPLYREAIASQRKIFGDDHPDTIRSLENLGTLLLARGQFDDGIKLHVEALAARRRLSGDLDPNTLLAINHIAGLLAKTGRFAEAIPMYTEVLAGARKVFGEHHPNTMSVAENLIDAMTANEQWADAEPYCRLVLEAARATSPDGDEKVADALERLGQNLLRQSRDADAEGVLTDCLRIRERILPEDHWQRWHAMSLLGEAMAHDPARRDEAKTMLTRSYEGIRRQSEHVEGIEEKVAEVKARRDRYFDNVEASETNPDD